jgi:hypothetical protein
MVSILLQPDQKLLVGGISNDTTGEQTFTIARFIQDTTTRIHEKVAAIDLLQVYLNPAKNSIQLKYNDLKIQSLQLIGLSGKAIKTFSPENKTLDISGIAAGTYFLKVKTKDREMTEKIVIK